jgi:hypothetical protein
VSLRCRLKRPARSTATETGPVDLRARPPKLRRRRMMKSGMGQALPGFDPSFQPSQPLLVLRSSSARDAVCWAGMVPPQGFEPRIPRCRRGALAAKLRRHLSCHRPQVQTISNGACGAAVHHIRCGALSRSRTCTERSLNPPPLPDWAISAYPQRDSNPHCPGFKAGASAVGLCGRHIGLKARSSSTSISSGPPPLSPCATRSVASCTVFARSALMPSERASATKSIFGSVSSMPT